MVLNLNYRALYDREIRETSALINELINQERDIMNCNHCHKELTEEEDKWEQCIYCGEIKSTDTLPAMTEFFDGINEVYIWNRALNGRERQALYNYPINAIISNRERNEGTTITTTPYALPTGYTVIDSDIENFNLMINVAQADGEG